MYTPNGKVNMNDYRKFVEESCTNWAYTAVNPKPKPKRIKRKRISEKEVRAILKKKRGTQ